MKFLDQIVWIDPNAKSPPAELQVFVLIFESQIACYETVEAGLEYVQENETENIIIMCSSRIIQECYLTFGQVQNVYPKFIIFCGSPSRAQDVINNHPYRQVVYGAYWEPTDILGPVNELDQKLSKNPGAMLQKIKIVPAPQAINVGSVSQNNPYVNPVILSSYPEGYKSPNQKYPPAPLPQEKVQQEAPMPRLTKESIKIFWVMENNVRETDPKEIKAIKQQFGTPLSKMGYPIDMIGGVQELRHEVTSVEFEYVFIARGTYDIEDLKCETNTLKLVIKVAVDASEQTYIKTEEEEVKAENVQRIAEILKENNIGN